MSTKINSIKDEESKDKDRDGFYQINLERVKQIACDPDLGSAAVCVYITLAGGVNSTKKVDRACTHGMRAVRRRTSISGKAINEVIAMLMKKGFLQQPFTSAEQSKSDQTDANEKDIQGQFPIVCLVDPDVECDLTMSQKFLQKAQAKKDVGARGLPGTLLYLRENIGITAHMNSADSVLDALLVFFALHKNQDFGAFSGIDPRAMHGKFSHIKDDHGWEGARYRSDVDGHDGWTLQLMLRPVGPFFVSDEFVQETLGMLPEIEGAPSLEKRFRAAFANLNNARLIYRAHVLWDSDPLDTANRRRSPPLFTSYIEDHWDKEREIFLQYDTWNAAQAAGMNIGPNLWGQRSNKEDAPLLNSGVFGVLLPNAYLEKATLLLQYRVRWWADDVDTELGLGDDKNRVIAWRKLLKVMVKGGDSLDPGQNEGMAIC